MDNSIKILEKPDWISWDEIHQVLWTAHAKNREKGMNMAFPALPGDKICEMIKGGGGKMFVAIDNNVIIGTAAFYVRNISRWCWHGNSAYFCFASVLPEYNGHGIYKKLSSKREECVKSMGIPCLTFDTHERNCRVIELNKKNGYKLVDFKICKDHYDVVMMKWLNGCPFSDWYINLQFFIRKCYKKLRYKPGKVKRFGI